MDTVITLEVPFKVDVPRFERTTSGTSLPRGVLRLDSPRADALCRGLATGNVIVASGESYSSAHGTDELPDLAIGRPNDKLWGSRIDPARVGAAIFAAIAPHTAGARTVVGRRMSTLARRYVAAGQAHAFIGVEGAISPRHANMIADGLLDRLMAMPTEPLPVVVCALGTMTLAVGCKLVVIGDASMSYARATGMR